MDSDRFLYGDISQRYGLSADLSDAVVRQKIGDVREHLKKEVRKELKIKEGAENLRKVCASVNYCTFNY